MAEAASILDEAYPEDADDDLAAAANPNWFLPNRENQLIRPSRPFRSSKSRPRIRVARFVMVQNTKTGKSIPNYHELYQMSIKYNVRP
jgi:hypothetical protein